MQPRGWVVSQPRRHGLVAIEILYPGHAAVLDGEGIRETPGRPIKFETFVHAPQVRERVSDEGIVDRIAMQIFLSERNVHASEANIQEPVLAPKAGDVFEIKIA